MSSSKKYILAHDMGTSANKAILIDKNAQIIDSVKTEYEVIYPQPGYAEQNPDDWWKAISSTTKELIDKGGHNPDDIAAVTFSCQMQGLLPMSSDDQPLMNSMIWLDGRGTEQLKNLWSWPRVMGYSPLKILKFLRVTGGSPGQAGKDQIPKMLWLKENRPDLFEQTKVFIDTKDYIIHRLTGEYATSIDLAYLWWLIDTRENRYTWHKGLSKFAGKEVFKKLPPLAKSTDFIGNGVLNDPAEEMGLNKGTPVVCGGGDATCAAVGSGMVLDNELHLYVGTSGWIAGHVTKRKVDISHYTGCIGSAYPEKYYLVYGHQEVAGAALEWVKNKILYSTEEVERKEQVDRIYQVFDRLVSESPLGAKGMMFTPWMFGERCPLDDNNVRGMLVNISLDHDRGSLLRAVFEGIAMNLRWALETVENLYKPVSTLNIIGGGARSDIWCQIFSDITKHKIQRVNNPQEAGAIGASMIAWNALGNISSLEDIKKTIKINQTFVPDKDNSMFYDQKFKQFQDLYVKTKNWFAKVNK